MFHASSNTVILQDVFTQTKLSSIKRDNAVNQRYFYFLGAADNRGNFRFGKHPRCSVSEAGRGGCLHGNVVQNSTQMPIVRRIAASQGVENANF